MPYDVQWLLHKRVVHLHVHGQITPHEAKRAYDSLDEFFATGITPVHLILEHTGLQKFPLSLHFYNFIIDDKRTNNAGWMVIVGTNRQARFVGQLFSYVTGVRSEVFDTMGEATVFLKSQDHSLV